jgi:uncharacterized protein
MDTLGRRRFLQGAVATAGGVLVANPFQALAAAAKPDITLGPVADLRDGIVRLHLPKGFQYRSFHDTEQAVVLRDGTALPGRHDGMGAFRARGGNVWLVRNHEVNGPGAVFGPGTPYDATRRPAAARPASSSRTKARSSTHSPV